MSSHIVLMQDSILKLFFMTDWGLHIKVNIMFCELYKILSLDGLKADSLHKFYKVIILILGFKVIYPIQCYFFGFENT